MITPEAIDIDGRKGSIVYLDAAQTPVEASDPAVVSARVLWDDGGSSFLVVQSSAAALKKELPSLSAVFKRFDEAKHPRDNAGKFTDKGPGEAIPDDVAQAKNRKALGLGLSG